MKISKKNMKNLFSFIFLMLGIFVFIISILGLLYVFSSPWIEDSFYVLSLTLIDLCFACYFTYASFNDF